MRKRKKKFGVMGSTEKDKDNCRVTHDIAGRDIKRITRKKEEERERKRIFIRKI